MIERNERHDVELINAWNAHADGVEAFLRCLPAQVLPFVSKALVIDARGTLTTHINIADDGWIRA